MRISLGIALILISATAHASPRTSRGGFDVGAAPRTRAVPGRLHGTLFREPPAPPPAPEVSVLGGLLGGVALIALGTGYVMPRGGGGGRRGIYGSRRSGYAALTPSLRRVREVALAPVVTPEGVHGGVSLRW